MRPSDELKNTLSSRPNSWPYPKDFMDVGISRDVAVILSGFMGLSILRQTFYERHLQASNGFLIENLMQIWRWEYDCDDADGWCDPPFEGYRIVLLEDYCPPMQVKRFPAGYEEALTYAYLTPDNAPEVVKWLEYFDFHPDLARMVREDFNIQD